MKEGIRVLIVEDNDTDAALVQRRLVRSSRVIQVDRVMDGAQAMEFLRKTDQRPDLILLDIQMPVKDGREVLGELRVDPELDRIPVVVLSGSELEDDRRRAYALGANSYLVKPGTPDQYDGLLDAVEAYWLDRNVYPPR